MNKRDFASATSGLSKGDRVRVQLRSGCFKRTEDFKGQFTGKVIETGPALLGIAMGREGLKWFTFYPVDSITLLSTAARKADA